MTRLSILALELEGVDWDVVVLFIYETHAFSEISIFVIIIHLFCTIDTNRPASVAILIRECHMSSARRVHRVPDRVMAIDVIISGKFI